MCGSRMACRAIHSWTLCSLVGAYLDLALVYLLLCGATLAYLAAKFLALFGLALPCSCSGFFAHPHRRHPCLQRLLVDHPTAKIASVQASLQCRFPFDSVCSPPLRTRCCCDVGGGGNRLGLLETGGDESCGSSVSNNSKNLSLPGPLTVDERVGAESVSSRGRAPDDRGKGILIAERPPPSSIRRRRRLRAPISGQRNPLQLGWLGASPTPFSVNPVEWGMSEESSAPADSGPGRGPLGAAPPIKWDAEEKDASSVTTGTHGTDESDTIIIRDLERALEEEQAARAALYLDLEKERSAAGTAADEAMAMILRLQKEKAAVEMEARQYHRMIEEKSAYDEEEMGILKEIIVRREREKHVLEEEVEAYRQMMLSGLRTGQALDGDLHLMGQSSEDPALMLQQICESIGKNESLVYKEQMVDGNGHFTDGKQGHIGGFGKESLSLGLGEDTGSSSQGDVKQVFSVEKDDLEVTDPGYESNMEFQEKGMVTMEVYPSSLQSPRSGYGEHSILDVSQRFGFHEERSQFGNKEAGTRDGKTEIRVAFEDMCKKSDQDADERGSNSSRFDAESRVPRVHDVHVIPYGFNLGAEVKAKENELSQMGCASSIYGKGGPTRTCIIDHSSHKSVSSWAGVDQNIRRSCSDMTRGQLMDNLCEKALVFGLKRSSMSAVDIERLKLETEVELLRKRLKIIQQGREKLNFSVEHREEENFQLQLLEEIACQLQEIRKITEPERSLRQTSLPPSSSKVNSKKRRCRSVSLGVHGSA